MTAASSTKATETKTKKEKKGRRPEFKVTTPLEAVPNDFDFARYAPLKKKAFKSTAFFLKYKASELRHKAQVMDAKAELALKTGDSKGLSTAKRLLKMQTRFEELKAELAKSGMDVDQALKLAKQAVEAKAAKSK